MRKRVLLLSISLGLIILLGVGVSYSMWNMSMSTDNVNILSTKCFNVEITSEKNSIALENAYPITNEKGKKLTPYSFTITNTCDVFASYQVNLESLKNTTLSSKFLDVMINNEEIKKLSEYESTDIVNLDSIESHILAKGSLGSGDSVSYTLRLWIDYDTTMEDLNNETKSLKTKIVVISQPSSWSPVSAGYDTLREAILANEYQTSPEVALKKIEAKGTPDLSQTAPVSSDDFSDKGLYKAVDDYGDTYYYRGNVTNNNVYFAGFYWQIVRINGDGSIRLLYNGTKKNAKSSDKIIGSSAFNTLYDKPAYVGYMYGNPDGETYEEVHSNQNSSTIKKYIDDWYKINIKDLNFEQFLNVNSFYCGSRIPKGGDGVALNTTTYFYEDISTLQCKNATNDLYSQKNSEIGNKSLEYPIGLITVEELKFAGMSKGIVNKSSYVFSDYDYWTMSPVYFSNGYASVVRLRSDGILYYWWDVSGTLGVRPVINLKPDVKISKGIGTINEPFIIDTTN